MIGSRKSYYKTQFRIINALFLKNVLALSICVRKKVTINTPFEMLLLPIALVPCYAMSDKDQMD